MDNNINNTISETTWEEIKKLLVAIEQSANTVMITNDKAEIEYVNPYFTQLTGYETSEVIGKNPKFQKSGFHSIEFYNELWETIKKGEKWIGEFYNRKKNGDFYWESATISPITDSNGHITNFIAIKEDITERKQQQDALKESETKLKELNATKDKFFSIIAHDMMNPVHALVGFSGLAVEAVSNRDFDRSLKYTIMIDQLSTQISDLFQNLLLWSRAQTGTIQFQPKLLNVYELINDSINILISLALKKDISIKVVADKNLMYLLDRNMVGTIVRNLIQNAIKFSYPTNTVVIQVTKEEKHVLFSVSDNGTGMPAKVLNNLFRIDNAYSAKGTGNETGTGLGLVICKEFITLHKGEIWAESEPGKGSRFYFTIPEIIE
jgi:two-component system, sensor histidine kinase and response regulator